MGELIEHDLTTANEGSTRVPFVPRQHLAQECSGYRLWHHRDERPEDLEFVKGVVSFAVSWLLEELAVQPRRTLHVCLYHANEEAQAHLNRDVPGNMAMAPFSSAEASLIVIHSRRVHPMNADFDRMRRVLVHELCHCLLREKTGSSVMLGDDLRDMRVRPWLDEGFAEVMSWRAIGESVPRIGAVSAGAPSSLDELDRNLNDLSSAKREAAFVEVARRVQMLTKRLGVRGVFENLVGLTSGESF